MVSEKEWKQEQERESWQEEEQNEENNSLHKKDRVRFSFFQYCCLYF
jgi:hypothetical protein